MMVPRPTTKSPNGSGVDAIERMERCPECAGNTTVHCPKCKGAGYVAVSAPRVVDDDRALYREPDTSREA